MSIGALTRSWIATLLVVASVVSARPAGGADRDLRLVNAVKASNLPAVRALVEARVDVNAPETDGTTPLHWAAYRNDAAIADALLRAGARATAANRYGVQPLSLAAVNGNALMIERLLRAGADPNTTRSNGETALMTAARTGVVAAVQVLLDAGADVQAKEHGRGQTALMWAAAEGHAQVIEALLARGANIGARSTAGFTALLFAARQGKIDAVMTLLDKGARLDESIQPERGRPAGAPAGAAPPADAAPAVATAPDTGLNAFLLAAANAHYELAARLLDRGANPNAAPKGWTALHQLSWVRKAGIAGSNDPAPEGSGNMDSLAFARSLVAHGADVNARVTRRPPSGVGLLNLIGGTPFFLAARTADADFMRLLAALGADPLLKNQDDTTPLMAAAGVGTSAPGEDPGTEPEVLEAVQVALKLGADPNAVDRNGETAMHGAAYKHVPSVVRFLADAGATIDVWNHKNKNGWTPLEITQGIHRGMAIISSPATGAAIREVMIR